MKLQKFRWSRVYESAEEELLEFMADRGVAAERQHIDEFESSTELTGETGSTIWCAEGSLQIVIEGVSTPMQPGDGAPIQPNTTFVVEAGFSGCVIYVSS